MYVCKQCGNMTNFIEHYFVETQVYLDEGDGQIIESHDNYHQCAEVVCMQCNASSEDGMILCRETGKPLKFL